MSACSDAFCGGGLGGGACADACEDGVVAYWWANDTVAIRTSCVRASTKRSSQTDRGITTFHAASSTFGDRGGGQPGLGGCRWMRLTCAAPRLHVPSIRG